ncbi:MULTISPECIES: hypothetical protein [Streptomyces]|uniref:Uncharacterized protein n=1 Tax=Streptomyces dengpaensis TaxID=2049881 RepID=A0ABN5IA77_9ACTN|nr:MULTISPECIES: hypothetical protein [Streptomyces]AVH59983.1 hypothetical protein C4B68_34095 [Streptomyces dengpaensis]PIB09621.1 hypothetical protein B1C81_10770 [Streptomyces sp. HG99]
MSDALDMSRPSWKLYNKLLVLGVSVDEASDLMNGYARELAEQQRRCPVCNVEFERFRYWLEDPEASVFERVVVTRYLPCGHEVKSAPHASAGPVRPGEEPTT